MVRIRCVVERIAYQNPENAYTVLKVRVKDHADLVPVVGNLLDVNVGSVLLAEGNWKVDAKCGGHRHHPDGGSAGTHPDGGI